MTIGMAVFAENNYDNGKKFLLRNSDLFSPRHSKKLGTINLKFLVFQSPVRNDSRNNFSLETIIQP